MKKILIPLLLSSGLFACRRDFRPVLKTGFEGEPIPKFNILSSDSSTVLNTADIPKGAPIVLMYFSPNCPYSQAEMNNIINDISVLKNIQFCIFTTWPFRQFKGFYAYFKLNKYSNIIAGEDFKHFFEDHFKPKGVPYTMVYNKDRILSKAFLGTMPSAQIEEVVAKD